MGESVKRFIRIERINESAARMQNTPNLSVSFDYVIPEINGVDCVSLVKGRIWEYCISCFAAHEEHFAVFCESPISFGGGAQNALRYVDACIIAVASLRDHFHYISIAAAYVQYPVRIAWRQ